ncbi:sugar phosphate nucleotidyltransferase [Escherichia coli]|uniref:sugar phosphate nucleotidyltransferase n=1 Tax=Escherichia coli TaxID=562 RepID=UPI0038910B33
MIYYPPPKADAVGIREIVPLTTPEDKGYFQRLLAMVVSSVSSWNYAEQPSPDGLAQAFIIGETFLNGEPSCLVLGEITSSSTGASVRSCVMLRRGARKARRYLAIR